jgi:two-component system OmpR family response regulator
MRILIIDDEKDLCELIHLILKDEDYKIECSFSLSEGRRKWIEQSPAIVLLDQNLPDGFGLDLIVNEPALLKDAKVIMITADTQHETRERAKACGVEYFIQKPFSLKLIRELVREIITVYKGV